MSEVAALVVVAGEGCIMVGDTTYAAAPGVVIEVPRDFVLIQT